MSGPKPEPTPEPTPDPTPEEVKPIIHLSLDLTNMELEDLLTIYLAACDQGQYGEANLIKLALFEGMEEYEALSRQDEENEAELPDEELTDDDEDEGWKKP